MPRAGAGLEGLAEFGRLDSASLAQVTKDAWEQVVVPMLNDLDPETEIIADPYTLS